MLKFKKAMKTINVFKPLIVGHGLTNYNTIECNYGNYKNKIINLSSIIRAIQTYT